MSDAQPAASVAARGNNLVFAAPPSPAFAVPVLAAAMARVDEARTRPMMAAQLPAEAKRARSPYVIDNDGDFDRRRHRTGVICEELVALATRPRAGSAEAAPSPPPGETKVR